MFEFTPELLDSIEKAIFTIQAGGRVSSVTYGDMQVQYSHTSLKELLQLRNMVKENLAGKKGIRQVRFLTSKGVD